MTEKPAAFFGNYSDLRFVRTRKVAAITVEIPIEEAARFIEAFGAPNPAAETPVAIARLVTTPPQKEQPPAPEKERKSWADMPPSQQAAIRCSEPQFRNFLGEQFCAARGWPAPGDEHEAASVVRTLFKIDSRRELNDPPMRMKWVNFDNEYYAWQRGYH